MRIPLVDLYAQYRSIQAEVDAAIAETIRNSAYIGGRSVQQFEAAFGDFAGHPHMIGCANGTDALEIILQAMEIGPGDEVLVPALTWVSTAEAVTTVGAIPVFCDIDPITYCISPTAAEQRITSKTKAIIPVHLYGHPANMTAIMALAKKHQLLVLEDCAQAHAAQWNGQTVGTFGDAATYSFYPGKNLGAYGDAGAMGTANEELAKRARMIANHGQLAKHQHQLVGRNSRLDGLQAAILQVKLKHLSRWTELRIAHAAAYRNLLQHTDLILPVTDSNAVHVFHLYAVQTQQREQLQAKAREQGIATAIHYPTPVPLLECYAPLGYTAADFPVAAVVCERTLSLPLYPEMTEAMIREVADVLIAFGQTTTDS